MDIAVHHLIGVRGIWGTLKAGSKSTGKRTSAVAALAAQIPKVEAEVKKGVDLATGAAEGMEIEDGE